MTTRKVNVRKTAARKAVKKTGGTRRKVVTKKAGATRKVAKKAGATRKVAKKRTGTKTTKQQLREIAATGAKQRTGTTKKTRTVRGSKRTTAQAAVPTNTYYTLEEHLKGVHKTTLAITVAALNQFGAFENRQMPRATLRAFFASGTVIDYHSKPTKTRPANWTKDKDNIYLNDHGIAWFSGRVDGSNVKQELTPELVADAVTLITTGVARGEYGGMAVRAIEIKQ